MTLSGLDRLFWAAGLLGHVVLLFVLFRRDRARRFPVFTGFIAASVLRTVVLFFARGRGVYTYFVLYWALAILVDVLLQFAVVYEMATHIFRPLGRWAPDARRGMTWLVGASLLVAVGLTFLATPASTVSPEKWVTKGSFFSSALMSELFIGMIILSVTVRLPLRTHVARISQALGLYSLVDVMIEAGHTLYGAEYHARADEVLSHARMLLYLLCLGYWIVTLWQDAPEPRELPAHVRKHLRGLQSRLAYDLYTLRSWRKP